jgi:serine/threonine protein kinase
MKGEEYKTKPSENYITILQEGKILQVMQGGIGIPHMHWCGQEEDYNFIVLEELDRSLDALLTLCGGKFSLKTILMLGQEIVSILQYFHFKNFTHNQLMPRNFLLGPGEKQGKLFIVDYGAASRFKDSQTLEHIRDDRRVDPRCINLEFSSVRYNRGEAVSRRDDMESLLYMLLYLAKGSLPWSEVANNLKKGDGDRARSVLKLKQ